MQSDKALEPVLPSDIDDESVVHLALVLAHRLRGLVASIEGFTDLLVDTLNTTEQRDLAFKIMEGASRIESVLADLQLYGESLEPVMLPVRVDELLRDLLVPLADEDRSRIELDAEPGSGARMLLADPFLLRQALLVLIQNALDATRHEGGIRVISSASDDGVDFHISNDGFIDLDDAEESVFIPFYTTKAHNLGVGLSIARRIVRMHEGTLALTRNDADDGTCFTLTLPAPISDDAR